MVKLGEDLCLSHRISPQESRSGDNKAAPLATTYAPSQGKKSKVKKGNRRGAAQKREGERS